MPNQAPTHQFILLPSRGVQAGNTTTAETASFLVSLHVARAATVRPVSRSPRSKLKVKVVDSVHENGAKLVELSPQSVVNLRAEQPGVRIVPVVYYKPSLAPRPAIAEKAKKVSAATVSTKIVLKVVSKTTGAPVSGVQVVAFTDFAERVGDEGHSNSNGEVRLDLGAAAVKIERLYLFVENTFWSGLKKNVTLSAGMQFLLIPIDLTFTDSLRFFYGNSPLPAGAGVKVGVIDTGIAAEPDLLIDGGFNAVAGENPNDFGDNGAGHGTHVAGIIAARGTPPTGIRGVAPGVTLRSYRVFGKNEPLASNFHILKALDRAVTDGCDIVNMSISSQDTVDEATHDAISHARANGTLVIVAAGNDHRSFVGAPASDPLAIAVSALGRKGTFPSGSAQAGDVVSPFGKDKKNYIAAFSNFGAEIDITAPGAGIISTFPGGYAILDGTSMACPAVTGAAAQLLATRTDILSLPRTQARSDEMAKAILQKAVSLGLPPTLEGSGLLNL